MVSNFGFLIFIFEEFFLIKIFLFIKEIFVWGGIVILIIEKFLLYIVLIFIKIWVFNSLVSWKFLMELISILIYFYKVLFCCLVFLLILIIYF